MKTKFVGLFLVAVLLVPTSLWAASGSDNFNRGNADPIDGSWNPISTYNVSIFSNEATSGSAGQDGIAFFTAFSPTANQEATITLGTWSGSGWSFAGAVVRGQDANNLYVCFANKNIGGVTTQIEILEGGGLAALASESSTTWAAGDTLRCKIEGTSINLYRNGSGTPLLNTSGDNTFSSGSVGMYLNDESPVNTAIDEFSATDVAGAAVRRRPPVIIQ